MNTAVKTPWEKVVKISIIEDKQYHVNVTIDNGKNIVIDLTPLVDSNHNFWRLKTPRYFKMIKIDPLGGLYWPQGEDISPEKIPYYTVKC